MIAGIVSYDELLKGHKHRHPLFKNKKTGNRHHCWCFARSDDRWHSELWWTIEGKNYGCP